MPVGVIHPVGVLLSRDFLGEELDFKVRLQKFDVHQFALGGVAAIGANQVQRNISVVRFDEPVHQPWIHVAILRLVSPLGYWDKALALAYFRLLRPHDTWREPK